LINGAPGSGKSTIASALAQDSRMTLALDIDAVKHCLGRWEEDPSASGLHARRLSLALASEQLRAGFDLVVGQYLAKTAFIEDLEELAERHGARFCEFVLRQGSLRSVVLTGSCEVDLVGAAKLLFDQTRPAHASPSLHPIRPAFCRGEGREATTYSGGY
jgi:hypothetical protein